MCVSNKVLFLVVFAVSGIYAMDDTIDVIPNGRQEAIASISSEQLARLAKISECIHNMLHDPVGKSDSVLKTIPVPEHINPKAFDFITQNSAIINHLINDSENKTTSNDPENKTIRDNFQKKFTEYVNSTGTGRVSAISDLHLTAHVLEIKENIIPTFLKDYFAYSIEQVIRKQDKNLLLVMKKNCIDPIIKKAIENKLVLLINEQLVSKWGVKNYDIYEISNYGDYSELAFNKNNLDKLTFSSCKNDKKITYELDLISIKTRQKACTSLPDVQQKKTILQRDPGFFSDPLGLKKISPCGKYIIGMEKESRDSNKLKAILWKRDGFNYSQIASVRAPQDKKSWPTCTLYDVCWNPQGTRAVVIWEYKKDDNYYAFQVCNIKNGEWGTLKDPKKTVPYRCRNLEKFCWNESGEALYIQGYYTIDQPVVWLFHNDMITMRQKIMLPIKNAISPLILMEYSKCPNRIYVSPNGKNIVYIHLYKDKLCVTFSDEIIDKTYELPLSVQAVDLSKIQIAWSSLGNKCALIIGNHIGVKTFCTRNYLLLFSDDRVTFDEKIKLAQDLYSSDDTFKADASLMLQLRLGFLKKDTVANELPTTTTTTTRNCQSDDIIEPQQKKQRRN